MKVLQKAELEKQICVCCGSYIEITYKDLKKSICNDVYWVCPCCHKEQDVQKEKKIVSYGTNFEVRVCECGAHFKEHIFSDNRKCPRCNEGVKL